MSIASSASPPVITGSTRESRERRSPTAPASIVKDKESEVALHGTNAHVVTVRVVTPGESGPEALRQAQVLMLARGGFTPLRTAPVASANTNEEGAAILAPVRGGRHRILVSHPAFASATADLDIPNTKEITITMMPGGVIEGRIHLAGSDPRIRKCCYWSREP